MENYFNTIYEQVDRSVFEVIRKEIVRLGYLPDITQFTDPTAFQNAKKAIVAEKGYVIDIFGAGSNLDKYAKRYPRIVYLPKRIIPGDIGGNYYGAYYEKSSQGGYDATAQPPQWTNYQFEVSLVAQKIDHLRAMDGIISNVLSRRDYVPNYLDNNQVIFVQQTGYRDFPDLDFGYLEYIYMYTAYDLLDRTTIKDKNLSPLQQIGVDIKREDITVDHLQIGEAKDSQESTDNG